MTTLPVDTPSTTISAASGRRYTTVAIVLHWVLAVAILFQLVGGKWMVSAGAAATGTVFTLFQVHKTVGLSILALTLARLIWRLAHPAPLLPDGMTAFERAIAHATHVAFYGFLMLVPLSGWAMASVSPTGVPTFFLLLENLPFAHLPLLGDATLQDRHSAEALLKSVHNVLSMAMGVLIVLHVAAALKHQFIARDNLLARMIISNRWQPSAVARASVGGVAAAASLMFVIGGIAWGVQQKTLPQNTLPADAETAAPSNGSWVIDHEQSSLGFALTYTGNSVDATVSDWSATILFDPTDLQSSTATITVDMTSIVIADATLQAQASGGDGFDLANHTSATYQADQFDQVAEGQFQARGVLTLRGISVDAPLTFSFQEDDGVAAVTGSLALNRLDFGIGAVSASDEAWLSYHVDVSFNLLASRP